MSAALQKADAEIAALQAEIATTERAPTTVAERYGAAEAELRRDAELYRTRGLNPSAGHPGETAFLQHHVLIGALFTATGEKLLRAERARIETQGEGLTAAD